MRARVANLFLARLKKFIGRGKSITRVPEQRAVAEGLDNRLPGMIRIILMNQQVDGSLPKNDVVGWPILPVQRTGIEGERFFDALQIARDE